MTRKLTNCLIAVFLLVTVSAYTFNGVTSAQQECPVDLVELETEVDLALPVLENTISQINGLLVLLAPIQELDSTGLLDPLVGSLLDLVDNTTSLLENLNLFLGADTADEQCAIALDICVQSQDVFSLIGALPSVIDSTLDDVLPLPILGVLLKSVLDLLFELTDFLFGTVDPVLGNLIAISCSQQAPAEMCEVIGGSPVCDDAACAIEDVTEGVTCDDFNEDPEGFCGDEVSCDDPNCVGTESCPAPECTMIDGSPDCSDEVCATDEVAEGVTCDDFNSDPEGFCGDEVSCDDPNCEGIASCDMSNEEGPAGGGGGGCTISAQGASFYNLLLPLLTIGGVLAWRSRRRKK